MRKIYILILLLAASLAKAQIPGCTDPLATNYNNGATQNDGSCVYSTIYLSPSTSVVLDASVRETSGLIVWNNHLLTQNDDADTYLHELDTLTGTVTNSYFLPNVTNTDWEEISQDSLYIYVGDFGNNTSGNRTDMHILRVLKSTLTGGSPVIDTIFFSYADQTDFTATNGNQTDFDCESMIVTEDSIILFTKQWVSHQTKMYGFPNVPGSYSANPIGTCAVNGLITGATYLPEKKLVVLCGYTTSISPFFFLLYDFQGHNFFDGNKRKLGVSLAFEQTEGVATVDGLKYYLSNERFDHSPIYNDEALHTFDLSAYLSTYINSLILNTKNVVAGVQTSAYPNPFSEKFRIKTSEVKESSEYKIYNTEGRVVAGGKTRVLVTEIDAKDWMPGMYFLKLGDEQKCILIKN